MRALHRLGIGLAFAGGLTFIVVLFLRVLGVQHPLASLFAKLDVHSVFGAALTR